MRLIQNLLILFSAGWLAAAETLPPAIETTVRGSLNIEGLTFSVRTFKPVSWASSSQESKYFKVESTEGKTDDYKLSGTFQIPQLPKATLQETLKQESETRWNFHAEIRFAEPTELAELGWCASMPVEDYCGRTLLINGKKLTLPLTYDKKKGHAIFSGKVSEMQIPTLNSRVTFRGNFEIVLQDGRAFGGDTYSLRLLFTPARGKIDRSSLDVSIAVAPYQSTPLDLSAAVTTGFIDEEDGDQKGGWTDQGAENDLRMIPIGRQRWNGIDFQIIDPAKNGGKSCIVLAGPNRGYFPVEAEAQQSRPVRGNFLYLLHALAWPVNNQEIGWISISYEDGSSSRISVTGGADVGNWWGPTRRRNGEVVWLGENKSAFVGLYRSVYPIENKPIQAISFHSNRRSVWGIVAASVSPEQVPRKQNTPIYILAGKEWQPIEYHKDFRKGSVLDFSNRLDAPAGKYGPVIIRNGKMVFRDRPEVPVRFYGTNLCGLAQYLNSKEWTERLADRLAALGYNAVRFHHHDNRLGLRRNETDRSSELDPEYVDQLDYLIACLRERGIYYTTDLYVSRRTGKGEIPEFPDRILRGKAYIALVFVLPSAMENWKNFAKNWLTHVNPYTGVAPKDDPALISLSLMNEDNIANCWYSTPESIRIYQRKFEEWKKDNHVDGSRSQQFAAFLTETYDKAFAEMKDFVRGLGVKTVLTDQNMSAEPLLSVMRDQYDFVDNHFYWDHPSFPETAWQLPSEAGNVSAISREAQMPARIFPTRLLDRPMTITEFDYAKPNFFRAEGAVLTSAYAALQDWSALFQFAYSHSREKVIYDHITESHFDTSTDVVKSLAQRIGVRLFLDRELEPARQAFAAVLTGGRGMIFSGRYSNEISRLGLIARVGTVILPEGNLEKLPADTCALLDIGVNFPESTGKLPAFRATVDDTDLLPKMAAAGVLKPEWFDLEKGEFHSSTGQISLNRQRESFKAVTPSCEVLILPEKNCDKGNFLSVNNQIGRGVFAVMSVDGKPLTESGRLLLLHLTNSLANKMKFSNAKATRLETWGELPFLAARGEAEIELATPPGAEYKLFTVNTAGERMEELPVARNAAGIAFPVKVFTAKGSVFAYELLRQ